MAPTHEHELDRFFTAYRAGEPRRQRDPFSTPLLAGEAERRVRRVAQPAWWRFLATSPVATATPALLAVALLLAPVSSPPVAERVAPARVEFEASPLVADPSLSDASNRVSPIEGDELLLLLAAGSLTLLTLRRVRG
jgi:hypothetical protein